MKNIFLTMNKFILSLSVSALLAFDWLWFAVISSEVPPQYSNGEIAIFILAVTATLLLLIIEIIAISLSGQSGSSMVLLSGIGWLIIWILSLHNINFNIGDEFTNMCSGIIAVSGIFVSSVAVISQLILSFVFIKKLKE